MPYMVERVEEFIERHGGQMMRARHGVYLFETGATLLNYGDGPQTYEPPDAPRKRLDAQRQYRALWLKMIERDFQHLKDALLGRTLPFRWPEKWYGPGPSDGKDALLRLKEIASEHRAALARIDAEIAELPEVKEAAKRAASLAEAYRERRLRDTTEQLEIQKITL